MHSLTLQEAEISDIRRLLADLTSRYSDVDDADFLTELPVAAHELPRRIRAFLTDFRTTEPSGVCLISGYPIDEQKIGPTPAHWNERPPVSPTLDEEMFFMVCASLLGDVFAWSTQQAGHLIHDVMPIRGHEHEQIGTGSEEWLWWHTEDAFSPFRGDYVGLMCLRNPGQVMTTVASVEDIPWDDQDLDTLFGDNYHIRPDKSHLPENRDAKHPPTAAEAALLTSAYNRIMDMCDNPKKRPILSGSRTCPYICLDPYFMDLDRLDDRAHRALGNLIAAVDTALGPLALRPGDCCFIDNFKTVHGRHSFEARYDGNDRWLKRLNITRNLRTSREARLSGGARVIF
jgi:L-asparagine oxygenase